LRGQREGTSKTIKEARHKNGVHHPSPTHEVSYPKNAGGRIVKGHVGGGGRIRVASQRFVLGGGGMFMVCAGGRINEAPDDGKSVRHLGHLTSLTRLEKQKDGEKRKNKRFTGFCPPAPESN